MEETYIVDYELYEEGTNTLSRWGNLACTIDGYDEEVLNSHKRELIDYVQKEVYRTHGYRYNVRIVGVFKL